MSSFRVGVAWPPATAAAPIEAAVVDRNSRRFMEPPEGAERLSYGAFRGAAQMEWSRREVLGSMIASVGAAASAPLRGQAPASQPKGRQRPPDEPFGYCLNTSTIRGNQLGIVQVVEAAAK